MGIGPGDRVVCQLANGPEHIVALGAAWMCSAIHVGVDQQLTASELSSLIKFTGATTLLYEASGDSADPFPSLRTLRQAHPHTRIIVNGDQPVPAGLRLHKLSRLGGDAESKQPFQVNHASPQDPATIFL